MKIRLVLLMLLPTLGIAAPNAPWEAFKAPDDSWVSGKTMARLSVPHGWLVYSRSTTSGANGSVAMTTTFIPDENHEWVLDSSLTRLVKPK